MAYILTVFGPTTRESDRLYLMKMRNCYKFFLQHGRPPEECVCVRGFAVHMLSSSGPRDGRQFLLIPQDPR